MKDLRTKFTLSKGKIVYLMSNYLAYGINFLSGLILARKLGPVNRGVFSYLSNLYLITLFLAPLNAKNAASIAETTLNQDYEKSKTKINQLILLSISFTISLILSLAYLVFLRNKFEMRIVLIFCFSNLFNSLAILNQIQEGKFRTQHKLRELATLRFLGYATPSFLIFLLYFIDKVEIEYVILGQAVAMVSCFCYLLVFKKAENDLPFNSFINGIKKTYVSFSAEYFVNFIPLIFVSYTENLRYLGLFAIAYGYSLIADTYFQVIESRIYFDLANQDLSIYDKVQKSYVKYTLNLFLSQLIFVPTAYLIPFLYGVDYEGSSSLAVILIGAKFLYSVVKIQDIYFNVLFKRFNIPILLNAGYMMLSIFTFLLSNLFLEIKHPWIFSILFAGMVTSLFGRFLLVRVMGRIND